MKRLSLPEYCYSALAQEIALQRVEGLDDIENVQLANGKPGGGITVYRGDRIDKVTMVDFTLGDGVPVPHHDNRLCVGAEIFMLAPDLTYKLPGWGINNVIMKDGMYYFDTDFSFGFDPVMEYDYIMKYVAPFDSVYRRFTRHPDFKMVTFYESTPWVRTYLSPLFFSAITSTESTDTVYELAGELIKLWVAMYRDAEKKDEQYREEQKSRLKSRLAGSKDSDRMGKVLLGAYGKETFMKFFKAMS